MPKRRAAQFINDPLKGMCESHKPTFMWWPDLERREAKGEHQEQCARCKRWLWPEERGENFTSTGRLDTD